MANISIIGSGSWGCALAYLLTNNGHKLKIWSFLDEEIQMFKEHHENTQKLPGVKLSEDIIFTSDLQEAVEGNDLIIMAVPSTFVRSTSRNLKPFVKKGQIIVNVAKGIEDSSLMILTDIIEQEIPGALACVLSGPSHAEEVGKGLPTTIVAGARDEKTRRYLQNIFMSPVFRVYTSDDLLGIEVGAALKNVVALAAGIADGLGYGDNTKAALITRGIAEIARLGEKMGAKAQTFYGLTGIGDLIVTCASVHSRNRKAGFLMGRGKSMKEAMDEVQMVVEGVYSAKAGLKLAKKYNTEVPIIETVNHILFENLSAADAVNNLMMREGKEEI